MRSLYIDFYKKLNSFEGKEYIENFLVYSLSLVITGVKPAATVNFKKNGENLYDKWVTYGRDFIREIDLDFIELRESNEAVIVMIFNEESLKENLFKESHMEFLTALGYSKNGDLWDYLTTLETRYDLYKCPHELGLFLGIPIEDVKDFMECTSKKCLMCGYWKVFNNHKKAQIIFNHYDRIKEHTVQHMLKGNTSIDLAFNLKNFFIP